MRPPNLLSFIFENSPPLRDENSPPPRPPPSHRAAKRVDLFVLSAEAETTSGEPIIVHEEEVKLGTEWRLGYCFVFGVQRRE